MSNGIVFDAIVVGVPQVAPASKDRLNTIALAAKSFQATNSSPFGPTNGDVPMDRPGPNGLSARVIVNVAPWSEEAATRMPPPGEPPEAASQAMYTLSRKGLLGLVSAVIIGLSLKWVSPPSKEKKIPNGKGARPSHQRGPG